MDYSKVSNLEKNSIKYTVSEVAKEVRKRTINTNISHNFQKLQQIKKIASRKQNIIRKKQSKSKSRLDDLSFNSRPSVVVVNADHNKSRNLVPTDSVEVSFPNIVVTRDKVIQESNRTEIIRSHRDHKPTNLKLDQRMHAFLKREDTVMEAPSNKSLKFLKNCKKHSKTPLLPSDEVNCSMATENRNKNFSRLSYKNHKVWYQTH